MWRTQEWNSSHATHVGSSNTFRSGMLHRHTSPCSNRAVNATQLGLQTFVLGAAPTDSTQPANKLWPFPLDWMNDFVVLYALLYIDIFVYEDSDILRYYVLLIGNYLPTFRRILLHTFLDASINTLLILFFPEDGGTTTLRNVCKFINYTHQQMHFL
jgi:hypothetical protein